MRKLITLALISMLVLSWMRVANARETKAAHCESELKSMTDDCQNDNECSSAYVTYYNCYTKNKLEQIEQQKCKQLSSNIGLQAILAKENECTGYVNEYNACEEKTAAILKTCQNNAKCRSDKQSYDQCLLSKGIEDPMNKELPDQIEILKECRPDLTNTILIQLSESDIGCNEAYLVPVSYSNMLGFGSILILLAVLL